MLMTYMLILNGILCGQVCEPKSKVQVGKTGEELLQFSDWDIYIYIYVYHWICDIKRGKLA